MPTGVYKRTDIHRRAIGGGLKDSEKVRIHLKELNSKPSTRKGKTYKEFYGDEKAKIIIKKFSNERHGGWRGDNVKYRALHNWVRRYLPKPKFCVYCKNVPPYDVANKDGNYTRDLRQWEWICRRCHMIKDGRLNKLKKGKV